MEEFNIRKIEKYIEKDERIALERAKKNFKKIKEYLKLPYNWEELNIGVGYHNFYKYYTFGGVYDNYMDEIFLIKNNKMVLTHELIHKFYRDIIVSPIKKDVEKIRDSLRKKTREVVKVVHYDGLENLNIKLKDYEKIKLYVFGDKGFKLDKETLIQELKLLFASSCFLYFYNINSLKDYPNSSFSFGIIPLFLTKHKNENLLTKEPLFARGSAYSIFFFNKLEPNFLTKDEVCFILPHKEQRNRLGFYFEESLLIKKLYNYVQFLRFKNEIPFDIICNVIGSYIESDDNLKRLKSTNNIKVGVAYETPYLSYHDFKSKDDYFTYYKTLNYLSGYINRQLSEGNNLEEIINSFLQKDSLILFDKLGIIKLPKDIKDQLTSYD